MQNSYARHSTLLLIIAPKLYNIHIIILCSRFIWTIYNTSCSLEQIFSGSDMIPFSLLPRLIIHKKAERDTEIQIHTVTDH